MKKILFSFVSLLVFVFAAQYLIMPSYNASAQGWTQGQEAVSSGQTGLPETSAKEVVLNILKWLLSLVFALTVFAFVGSGVMFIMSFSNNNIVTMAKDWLTYAIIGLVVSVLGFVIVLAISNVLKGDLSTVSGRSGGSGRNGGFWANIWGQDNNGNDININTGPDGTTVDGRLGDFEFNGIPLPISAGAPAEPWVNPDTGQQYDYDAGR